MLGVSSSVVVVGCGFGEVAAELWFNQGSAVWQSPRFIDKSAWYEVDNNIHL